MSPGYTGSFCWHSLRGVKLIAALRPWLRFCPLKSRAPGTILSQRPKTVLLGWATSSGLWVMESFQAGLRWEQKPVSYKYKARPMVIVTNNSRTGRIKLPFVIRCVWLFQKGLIHVSPEGKRIYGQHRTLTTLHGHLVKGFNWWKIYMNKQCFLSTTLT